MMRLEEQYCLRSQRFEINARVNIWAAWYPLTRIDVKDGPESSKADEDACNGGIDGPRVFAQSTGEEERNLKYHRKTLDEGPILR